jgi:hypothetical protein
MGRCRGLSSPPQMGKGTLHPARSILIEQLRHHIAHDRYWDAERSSDNFKADCFSFKSRLVFRSLLFGAQHSKGAPVCFGFRSELRSRGGAWVAKRLEIMSASFPTNCIKNGTGFTSCRSQNAISHGHLILLRHKRRRFDCRMQQGQRDRFRAMATISLRRIVAIEFGM